MAELSSLLGFMSAWDRRAALAKYEKILAETGDMDEILATHGSPTKLAITLALNYVPSPPPAVMETEEAEAPVETETENAETPAETETENAETPAVGDELPEAAEEEACAEVTPAESEAAEEEKEEKPAPVKKRRVRFFGLLASILFGLIIGLPIALVLICLGIPFIAIGAALGVGAVWGVLTLVPLLAMISDILVVVGVGLAILAAALFLAWLGLWISFELGYLWISGVVLRLGRVLTYKKEVAVE